ncbi:MAG TPA: hypothetical protein VI542_16285 [Candidatus Tectomicrobia bacterium]
MSPPCMPYAEIQPLIRSGDLLLAQGNGPMSKMIQYATESPYSHVGFLLRLEALDRIMVLESVESIGIRAATLSGYVADYNGSGHPYPGRLMIARHQAVDLRQPEVFQTFSRTAIDLLGYPYDTQEIVEITARIVGAKLGMPPRPVRDNRTFICSEYCMACFKSIGISIPYNRANFIAPGDFASCPEVDLLWEIGTDVDRREPTPGYL